MTTKRPVGRPSKLTEDTKKKLEHALIACCTIAEACAYADIDDSTFRKWSERARADMEAGKDSEYVTFLTDITRAIEKAKPRLIMLLNKHAEKDYRANLAILERRYPEDWGKRESIKIDSKVDGSIRIIVEEVDGDES